MASCFFLVCLVAVFFVRQNVYYLKAWRTQQQTIDLPDPSAFGRSFIQDNVFLQGLSWRSQHPKQTIQSLLILEVRLVELPAVWKRHSFKNESQFQDTFLEIWISVRIIDMCTVVKAESFSQIHKLPPFFQPHWDKL